MVERNEKLGLTLSGGAARGFAHIGALRAFEEAKIKIDCVSGSSIGALIGLFYAAGKTPDEMIEIACSINKKKLNIMSRFQFGKTGIDYVEQFLKKHIVQRTFEELNKPLFVCVTNFQSGKYEIIEQGEIIPAVCASAAIPIKFKPVIINNIPYIDGGMINNLPVEPLRKRCKIVVGISVNPVIYNTKRLNFRKKIMRLAELLFKENEALRIKMCDYHFEIQGLGEIDFEDYHRVREVHDMGYRATKDFLEKNRLLL